MPIEVDESCLSTIDEVFTAAKHYLKEPLLSQLRVYLSLVTTSEYDISPALQEVSIHSVHVDITYYYVIIDEVLAICDQFIVHTQ